MFDYLGDVTVCGHKITVYRSTLSGMMLYLVNTETLIVKGYIVALWK